MSRKEAWLNGPVPDVPPFLQPVAHGLLHYGEEMTEAIRGMSPGQLSATPGGVASVSFHVRHAMGSLDRLFTYARGDRLSDVQFTALADEANGSAAHVTWEDLAELLSRELARAMTELKSIDDSILLDARWVGRAQLPSTVIGLLSHAVDHLARHTGQMIATAGVVRGLLPDPRVSSS